MKPENRNYWREHARYMRSRHLWKIYNLARKLGVPTALCEESPEVWRVLKLRRKRSCMA